MEIIEGIHRRETLKAIQLGVRWMRQKVEEIEVIVRRSESEQSYRG